MGKEKMKFRDRIVEIPEGEQVLLEGVLLTMRLYGNKSRYPYKYTFTDKGIWTRSKKFLFFKPKVGFLAYSDIDSYKKGKYGRNDTYIFYTKGKKSANRIFFDNVDEVDKILEQFLTRIER